MMTLACVWLAFLLTSKVGAPHENIIEVEAEVRENVSIPIIVDDNFRCRYLRFGRYKGESDPNLLFLRQLCSKITSYGEKYPDGKKYQVLPSPSGKGFLIIIYDVRLEDAGQYQLVVVEERISTNETEIRNYIRQLIVNNSSEGGKLENAGKNPRVKGENTSNKLYSHVASAGLEPVTHPIGPTNDTSDPSCVTNTSNEGGDKKLSTTSIIIIIIIVIVVVIAIVIVIQCKRQNQKEILDLDELERLNFDDYPPDTTVLGDNRVNEAL